MSRDPRRAALGHFLKSRRRALDPAARGFAVDPRRRAEGLRRAEVAQLAGVSTEWYTRIEVGDDVGIRLATLERIADALALDADERGYLRALQTPPPPLSPSDDVPPGLLAIVERSPFPALIATAYYTPVSDGWKVPASDGVKFPARRGRSVARRCRFPSRRVHDRCLRGASP